MTDQNESEYDAWNVIKKKIHAETLEINFFPKEGEIWMASVGKNIGHEQNGSGDNFSRPLLIIKKFNNQMFWCVPLSSKQKSLDFYFNFTDTQGKKVSAILAQMKLVSIHRLKRKLYEMPSETLSLAKVRLRSFLEESK